MKADIAIIGAGVVGCAIAREIALRFPQKKIVVFEKNSNAGLETSARNSGILHSGLQQKAGSLKSRLAREGSALTIQYIQEHELPMITNGMLIAISRNALRHGLWRDTRTLMLVLIKGLRQNEQLKFLTWRGVKKLEPFAHALGGIFIPHVAVIDAHTFVQSLKKDAEKAGVVFLFNTKIKTMASIRVKIVINCAGLGADTITTGWKQYPWRGEYYEIVGFPNLISRPIFPAMPPQSRSKGILIFPTTDGRILVGPNTRPVPRADYYEEDKTPPDDFLKAIHCFFPHITAEHLRWAYSGIRPKLTNDPAETDFVIQKERSRHATIINLVGIDSPGLSAAMAIAKHVLTLL